MRIVDLNSLAQIPGYPTHFGAAAGGVKHFTHPHLMKAAHLHLIDAPDNAQQQIEFDFSGVTA